MFAVIETGGKQHIVELGTELEVELLDVEPGQEINLERVLFVADGETKAVGRPLVADAIVSALVLGQARGEKTISFKYRPKARRRVKKGHRQELTVLRITDVRLGDHSAAADAKREEAAAETEREKIAEAAARQAAEDAALAEKLAARSKQAETEAEPVEEAKPRRGRARTEAAKAEPAGEPAEAEPTEGTEEAAEEAAERPARRRAAKPAAKADEEQDEAGVEPAAESSDAGEATSDESAPKKRARTKKDE